MRAKTHFDSRGAAGRSLAARVSSFAGTKTNSRGARDAIAAAENATGQAFLISALSNL